MSICVDIKGLMPACAWWRRQPPVVRRVLTLIGLAALGAAAVAALGDGDPAFYRWTWHIPG